MPSVSVDFVYSMMALLIVSTILTCSFIAYVNPLRERAEVDQLQKILNHIASKAEEVLLLAKERNSSITAVLQLPLRIGNRDYSIQFTNRTSQINLEGRLIANGLSSERTCTVALPSGFPGSGLFYSKYGTARIQGILNSSSPKIVLGR